MLISTKPKNAGEAAVIARSRQLTDFKWTPIFDVPTYSVKEGQCVIPMGVEATGFPYASTEKTDRFIAENISFESFVTAIRNPYSKLYQPGHAAYNASNFGIVCNGLVRYAFGIRERYNTKRWYDIPGMREVKPKGEYTVDEIELCDVLHAYGEGRNHVSLITDILKNEKGEIELVEVSEAVRPLCKRESYTPEVFYEKFSLFALCRYDLLESVPPLDEKTDSYIWQSSKEIPAPKISVDNGNRSNYKDGEEIVFSVFSEKADTVVICKDGEIFEEVKTAGRAFFPRRLAAGNYVATLRESGESVEFAVVKPKISFEVSDGAVTVSADSMDEKSRVLYMDFRKPGAWFAGLVKCEVLTEEERRSGKISRPIPDSAENFKIYFENEYGVWTHSPINLF